MAEPLSAFRPVPRTGVIYVTAEATRRGFSATDPSWCNLGQGQPETGELAGAPPRVSSVPVLADDQDYAPVAGIDELREAVAGLYNDLYRRGRKSKYTRDNVAVTGGGRVALMRACAAIAPLHLGHFLPDYTAYTELLDVFRRFVPIPIMLDPKQGYAFSTEDLRNEILGRGLGALLISNPCNPTGKLVEGAELAGWVNTARELDCTLLLDEFYSHYIWSTKEPANLGDSRCVSAAEFVEDVNQDPIILVDGLTKNWRYPGWRVTWVVGPSQVIEAVTSAGSFLDGGGSRPMQRAAVELLGTDYRKAETAAIQQSFRQKRDQLLTGLRSIGVTFDVEPEGTFYAWGNLANLPAPLRTGTDFFQKALEEKVICVPGQFFDVDPGGRRNGRSSRFEHHARFSFGPEPEVLEAAVGRLSKLVSRHS